MVRVNIVADEVNIDRQTRTTEQCQRTSPNQDQLRARGEACAQALQDGDDLSIVHKLPLPEFQSLAPDLFRVLVGSEPVDERSAQFPVAFCQRSQVFFRIIHESQVQFLREKIRQRWAFHPVFFASQTAAL